MTVQTFKPAPIEKVRDNVKHPDFPGTIRLCLKRHEDRLLYLSQVLSGDLTGVFDHGMLLGLADDDHSQYLHLGGRVGGQTLTQIASEVPFTINVTTQSDAFDVTHSGSAILRVRAITGGGGNTYFYPSGGTTGVIIYRPNSTDAGRIGIGTESPSASLHIINEVGGTAGGLTIQPSSTGSGPAVTVSQPAGGTDVFTLERTGLLTIKSYSGQATADLVTIDNLFGNVASVPLTLRGKASQTGNLLDWESSTPTRLGFISAAGMVEIEATDGQFIIPSGGQAAFASRPTAGGTPLRLVVKDSSDNVYLGGSTGIPNVYLNPAGVVALRATTNAGTARVRIGNASAPSGTCDIQAAADEPALIVRGLNAGVNNIAEIYDGDVNLILRQYALGDFTDFGTVGLRIYPNGVSVAPALTLLPTLAAGVNRTATFPDASGTLLMRLAAVNTASTTLQVGTTSMISAPTTQVYQFNAYMHCVTAGDATDTVTLRIHWNDGSGTKTIGIMTLNLSTVGNFEAHTFSAYHVAGTALQYSTILTSPGVGTPAHSIRIRITALG